MSTKDQDTTPAQTAVAPARRAVLKKLGRLAAVTPPAVTLLLSGAAKPAVAQIISVPESSRQFKQALGPIEGDRVLGVLADLAVEHDRGGRMAGELHRALGIGAGGRIAGVDAAGICLAAIKGLSARIEALESGLAAGR